jgi:hypothetical protein
MIPSVLNNQRNVSSTLKTTLPVLREQNGHGYSGIRSLRFTVLPSHTASSVFLS